MLDRATIERMEAAGGGAPVLIALSGGGDSVALLHLLADRFGPQRLRAAIVDHALREGSAADARRAAGFAEALGVGADILAVSWEGGANRGQQAARAARYRALCALAREKGLKLIAAAHTADDQAETVLMRAAAGSGWRGLAGAAPLAFAPVWPEGRGIMLARPLLAARRSELRLLLRERGASWIEDPANSNPAFERVRVRRRLGELESAGFDPLRLARLAARLRRRAEQIDHGACALIGAAADIGEDVRVRATQWQGPDEVRRRALTALIAAASGEERTPSAAGVAELEAHMLKPAFRGATYAGAVLAPWPGGVRLSRDPGAVLGRAGVAPLAPLPLPAGKETVWDGRIALTAHEPGWRAISGGAPDQPVLEAGGIGKPLAEAGAAVAWRQLGADRARHLLGVGVPRAKHSE